MDRVTQRKWDRAARSFDLMNGFGPERRWAPHKRELYAPMSGRRVLFVGVGTGLDIQFFPPGAEVVGIDISSAMLERAGPRADAYEGSMELVHADVHELDFEEGTFEQAYSACTFCSVPRPVEALRAVRRVLRPGGELRMFEHTGSRYYPFRAMLDAMNPVARKLGPEVNRPTVRNVEAAGFRVTGVRNLYLDIVRLIRAVAP